MHVPLLGVDVTPITMPDLLSRVDRAARDNRRFTVAAHNLHSVYIHASNPEFADFYQDCDVVVIDGWPVLAALNIRRRRSGESRLSHAFRFGSTDWILQAVTKSSVKRVCVLGTTHRSNEMFLDRLLDRRSDLEVLGIPGNPWSESLEDLAIRKVVAFDPDFLIVGMGMPLQEAVVRKLHDAGLNAVVATVGGAIDQLSGEQALAPRWTGRARVEWLWRLVADPRRLSHRYLVEPLKLAVLLSKKNGVFG